MIASKENIIKSDNYFNKLKNISFSINRVSKKSRSEADVISAFDSYFVPSLREDLDLDINFSREEYVDIASDSTRIIKKGRIDSRVGSLIIEFKHFSKFHSIPFNFFYIIIMGLKLIFSETLFILKR